MKEQAFGYATVSLKEITGLLRCSKTDKRDYTMRVRQSIREDRKRLLMDCKGSDVSIVAMKSLKGDGAKGYCLSETLKQISEMKEVQ